MESINGSQPNQSLLHKIKANDTSTTTTNQTIIDIKRSDNYEIHCSMQEQRSWFKKTFGPMQKGSLRAGIINILQIVLGAGCLSLPYTYKQNGLVIAIIMTIFSAILVTICTRMLVLAAHSTNTNRYQAVMKACFGKKSQLMLMTVLFICTLGTIISYFIMIAAMVTQIVTEFTVINEDVMRISTVVVAAIMIFPLSVKKDLSSLKCASIIGVLAIIYIIVVVLVQTPFYLQNYHPRHNLQIEYFKININLPICLNINLYSYVCTQCLFEVNSEISQPSLKKTYKLIDRSIIAELLIYLVLGFTGYISTLSNTPDVVLTRDTLDGNNDYFMFVAQITLALSLFLTIPLIVNPGRSTFSTLVYGKEYATNRSHLMITIFYVFFPAIIAIMFPKIVEAISFLGGTCYVFLGVTFPVACYIKTNKYSRYSAINICLLIANILVSGLSFFGAFTSLFAGLGILDLPSN